MVIAAYLFLIGLCCIRLCCAQDPCDERYHTELHSGKYRGTKCIYNNDKPVTDHGIQDGWYKVNGLNGPLQMPESPIDQLHCGTTFPIWMNGSHPTKDEAEVNRTGCVSDQNEFCSPSYDINLKVKNCSTFYVYRLVRTTVFAMAYCFGIDEPCPPFDPCDEYEHEELDNRNGDRASMCPTVGSPMSDQTLVQNWYNIKGTNGSQVISSRCPNYKSCSTQYPVWINGSIPAIEENIVKREACVRDVTTCCTQPFNIEIKNCSTFIVYKLTNTQLGQRYCTDDRIICIASPTTEPSVDLTNETSTPHGVAITNRSGYFLLWAEVMTMLIILTI